MKKTVFFKFRFYSWKSESTSAVLSVKMNHSIYHHEATRAEQLRTYKRRSSNHKGRKRQKDYKDPYDAGCKFLNLIFLRVVWKWTVPNVDGQVQISGMMKLGGLSKSEWSLTKRFLNLKPLKWAVWNYHPLRPKRPCTFVTEPSRHPNDIFSGREFGTISKSFKSFFWWNLNWISRWICSFPATGRPPS